MRTDFYGRKKAVSFSFDDGVTQDIRLAELFRKYSLKATFNINSELLGEKGGLIREGKRVSHNKNEPSEIKKIYSGFEIAAHTLTHPLLPKLDDEEIVRQVEQDRIKLSALAGYEVIGMAYPGGGINNDERTAAVIAAKTGVKYARTITSTHSFDLQADLFRFNPTVHSSESCLTELAESFIRLETDTPKLLYIWGHSYEFDINDTWNEFEDFCRLISGHEDIFYGENREVLL